MLMISRSEVDYSITRACDLIDATMTLGDDCLRIDENQFALARDFLSTEITRFEKETFNCASDALKIAELELRCIILKPLKLLRSQIELVMQSDKDEKIEAAMELNKQVQTFRSIASTRAARGVRAEEETGFPKAAANSDMASSHRSR